MKRIALSLVLLLVIAGSAHATGGVPTSTTVFHWDGTMGTLSGCAQQYGLFSASSGQAIDIRVHGRNGSGAATIKASVPRIFNNI
jgi:hypothetical protein